MTSYNVLNWNFNSKQVEYYDVMPYFIREYKSTSKADRPQTFEEFREFVKRWGHYMFWSRCQYEIIISQWPPMRGALDYAEEIKVPSINGIKDETQRAFLIPKHPAFYDNGRPKSPLDESQKIDIWDQIEMNLDIVVTILMKNVNDL